MNKRELLESLEQKEIKKEILDSFSKVRREEFVPQDLKVYAYDDTALPIGKGQTISQPYTIAVMLSLLELKKGQKILEVGSGSGYVLALLSEIVGNKGNVFGLEVIKELSDKSKKYFAGYENVQIYNKSGVLGLEEKAPFDRILISAACTSIPENLISQLKNKGIIVAPIGSRFEQSIVAFKKTKAGLTKLKEISGFVFVPFVES